MSVDDDAGLAGDAGRSIRASRACEPAPVALDAYFRDAAAVLAAPPSVVADGVLADLLARHYGLSGEITTLSSEVECTAEVALGDGRRLILKTSRRPEAVESFRFQSAAIATVAGAAGFVAPLVLPTGGGGLMFAQDGVCGYLQTRLEGTPMHRVARSPDLLRDVGSALGRLDLALSRRELPAMHRPVLWHVRCWPRLMELQRYLPAGPVADEVARSMRDYEGEIAPAIGSVPWQIAHNDPSPFNTLVSEDGIAFIDFGDGCWGPRIQDLAIAASHLVSDPALPLGGAEHLIAGYAAALPLSTDEARLLVGLMRARQSALILINYWRAHLFPGNADYIKKNVARAEQGLAILAPLDPARERAAVMEAAAMS
ncbi:Ser/Thr protein kinase RdoA involved in Cpx stress response, MazF antagonist [Bosea sp. OK403]|uniref:phosphotransferase n=1 Tax=Bosea sp. OK403 TaxID=1855286 RepID=UPI0008EB7F4E|nr:phosphotransferase [Bosea sp. OK403]SFJ77323.1 Ser/Thr protein kinase RdoA involved in Cpx stress response, MazF antagonist [Bosea sp. OK403]